MPLKLLFDLMRLSSYKLRRDDVNADGLHFWQHVKSLLANHDDKIVEWLAMDDNNPQYKEIMSLPEYTINGYGKKSTIELNHFNIQIVRIPKTDEASIRKIMQIALNLGQYEGTINKRNALKHFQLEHFISDDSINDLESKIPSSFYQEVSNALKNYEPR